ncbi:GNAT family N-acetyltransferase [Kribbella sp. NPDC051770]|uniref:GNAT family N-acetyltransferase n=1 Tax=Kribbella sp. NPDC051770 TaxID=3155413 RepID=UPI0034431404
MTIRYGGPGLRIAGDGLVLREWERGDLVAMSQLFDDPDVAYWTPLRTPFDLAAAEEYYDAAHTDNGRIHLAITTDGEQPLGEVMINQRTSALGYVVGSAYRGRGLAGRALDVLTGYAHEVLGLHRVILEIEPGNEASEAVATRTGYTPTDLPPIRLMQKSRDLQLRIWSHPAD